MVAGRKEETLELDCEDLEDNIIDSLSLKFQKIIMRVQALIKKRGIQHHKDHISMSLNDIFRTNQRF